MASKTSGSRKLKKRSLPKFEVDVYSKLSSGELIVFAVYYLIEHKIEVTHDDIVSACFLLFPHKFSLKKYPKWPDSAYVGRRWSDIRRKRYIAVNNDPEYKLTVKGLNLVKKVSKALGLAVPKPAVKVQPKQIPVKKIETTDSVKVAIESIKKETTPPAPVKQTAIPEIKKLQLDQEAKATPPEPVKKKRAVRVKKVSPTPEPEPKPAPKILKQISAPEIKKTQPVQEVKVTPPEPVKKKRAVRVKKVLPAPEPAKEVQAPEVTVQPAPQGKKIQPIQEEKAKPAAPVKKTRVMGEKKTPFVPAAPEIKSQPETQVKKVQVVAEEKAKAIAPVEKTKVVRAKKSPSAPVQKAQTVPEEKVTQLELISVAPVRAEKIAPTPVKQAAPVAKPVATIQPKKARDVEKPSPANLVKETKPAAPVIVQAEPVPVSKEAKERAGKFTRMMERSDAYIHYKKNGNKSNINEFDFRSLLLCTMESSAETLARNVELFKGYASIQRRQDLTVFLDFCEDKFSYLLKPQNKPFRKPKK